MSGFWMEHEEAIVAHDAELTHSVLSYPREAFLYWLAAWNHCWVTNEQFRATYGFAPWLAFKSPAERDALGEGPGRILTRENEIILPGQDG